MTKKGFTLIELMVTVTIMMIMTLIVFFNYNRFNESSLLNAFAYDMSLTIRQAQAYGTIAKESGINQSSQISTASTANFKVAYGVHFAESDQSHFSLFADVNGDGVYTSGGDGPVIQSYSFQRGIKIKRLCFASVNGGSENCSEGSAGIPDSVGKHALTLDITFLRPNPEAKILPNDPPDFVAAATIYLQNADGTITRSVSVYSTGQISVK
jgi:prepilin-type N-terminal cleavage/methylation domain-containing protein